MGQYKVYSEEEKRWITLPMAFQGEQGVKGEPGDDGVTPMFKIVSGMWNVSYDNGRTWGEVGPANGTSINDVQAIVDSSTGTPSATASYSGPDNARTLTFRFSGLKGEIGPKGNDGAPGKDGMPGKDGVDGKDGQDGIDGIDGSVYEYVYFRGFENEHKPITPNSVNTDDYIPTETKEVTINGNKVILKWTDRAQGVDSIYKYEWRSERKKEGDIWSAFTAPILWAKFGEKGKDGDGVQYIFKLTSNYSKPTDKITPDNYLTNSIYQGLESEEYVPTSLGWTDDPKDISGSEPYCWVAIRKYKDGVWGPYSTPSLWAKFGKDDENVTGGNGISGTTFEFIYKRVSDENIDVVAPYSENVDGSQPDDWSLFPQGVTDDYHVEYVCQRKKTNGVWGEYSDPAIWAMYGKIGRDGNGIEYIFKLTKSEFDTPGIPDAPSDIDPESYPNDWSDDPLSITEELPVCWVSVRKQYYNIENGIQYWSDYSEPSVWSRRGSDGKDGGGRTIFMFTATESKNDTPTKPGKAEITWNPDTNEITTTENSIWKPNTDQVSGKYVWMTTASYNSAGNIIGDWGRVICITGDSGENGADGLSTEFIYRLIPNESNFSELKTYLTTHPLSNTSTGEVPSTDDTICDSEWTNHPTGIDGDTWYMEVVCVRTKTEDGSWSDWEGPIRWAVWGEDGIDGDGVEYIFKVTPDDIKNDNIDEAHTLYIPPKSWYDENGFGEIYQTNEFYPGDSWADKGLDLDWTDEPRDVSPTEPLEWVSIRRKINGVWGDFSKPKLWARYAEDGPAYITSYVFTRSNEKPETPNGGNFSKRIPDGGSWTDTILPGTEQVWMSYRTFCSADPNFDSDWSSPLLMQDRHNFQVEYSTSENQPNIIGLQNYVDKLMQEGNPEPSSEEVEAAFREENTDWSDEATNAIWMATASYNNGTWTNWNVTRIKGEKGDTGNPGTGISIQGSLTFDQLVVSDNYYFSDKSGDKPNPYFKEEVLNTGDCYIISSGLNDGVDVSGHLFVYDGSGNNFSERWIDAGLVKGDPGQSMYLYMAFSDDMQSVKLTGEDIDRSGGKYVGYKVSDTELDKDKLKEFNTYTSWSKWEGDDGFGIEQIFLLTKYFEAPNVPEDTNPTLDHCPEHGLGDSAFGERWTDRPLDVSEEFPYQWVVHRKWDGVTNYEWRGNSEGKASLYNRYSYDGVGAYKLSLSQDYFLVPCDEDGTVDSDFKESVSTTLQLFIGDDPVTKGVTYSVNNVTISDQSYEIAVNDIKNLGVVTQYVCVAKYNDVETTATFTIEKTQTAYNIDPQVHTIKKDPTSLLPLIDSFNVNVYRWNGTGWSNYAGNLYYKFIGSGNYGENQGIVQVNSGKATISISDKKDLESIKLYLAEHSKYYEQIDFIKDGADGLGGKDAEFSIFRIYNQMDQIYVGPDDLTVTDQTFVTEAVLVTEDGEKTIPDGVSFSVSGIANTASYEGGKLSIVVKKGTYVSGDSSLNITYGNQIQSMYLKRIKGFTEYSLKSNELFVAVGTEKLTATIVEKVIGSDILTELTEIPSGFTTIWKYGDTSVNNDLEFDSSKLKENDQVTLSLYKGIDLVDSMTFEVISESTTGYIINNSVDQVYLHKHRLRSRIDNEDYSAWNFSIQKFEEGGHTDITSCEINSVKVTAYDVNNAVIDDLTDKEYKNLDGNTILSPSLNHWFIDRVTTRINKNVDVTLWHRESTKFFEELLKGNVEKVSKIEVQFKCTIDGENNEGTEFTVTLNVLGSEEDYDIVFNDITISDTPTFYVTSGKVYINKAYEFIHIGHYNISGEYDVSRKVPMGYRVMVGYDNVWTTYSEGAEITKFDPTEDTTYTIKLEKQYSDSPLFGQGAIHWKLIDQVDVYPMHIDYDIRLDNTFALVHLNPDGTIANGNTVSTAIKVLAAGVEEKNWSLVSDNKSEGLYIECDNVITKSLDGGVLTFNFAEDKTLTNKTITLGYRKNLGQELIEVASATITLETDSPYVDYDLVSDVYTITDLGNTYKPSTFKLSILEKVVGSNNTVTSLTELPTGYSVKIDGESANINKEISIPRSHNNMDPIKVQLLKGEETVVDQVEINIVKTHGERGLMLYPAGEWNREITYKIDNNATPYVLYDGSYYVLLADNSEGDTPADGSTIWQKMETFKSVYTDVIVSKYGNIGGAVFMDYTETIDENNEVVHNIMFSLQGKANGDNGSENYTDFLKSKKDLLQNSQWDTDLFTTIKTDSKFIPNVLIDFTTGDAWFGGGDTILSGNGNSDVLFGNMTKVESDPNYPEIMYFLGNESDGGGNVTFTYRSYDSNSKRLTYTGVSDLESIDGQHVFKLKFKDIDHTRDISLDSITLIIDLNKCKFNQGSLKLNDLWGDTPNLEAMHLFSSTAINGIHTCYMTFDENGGFLQRGEYTGEEDYAYIVKPDKTALHIDSTLSVNGAVIAYGFSQASDERLKDFFDDVNVDLEILKTLNKKYFKYKNNNLPIQLGMSAQEVQKIYPEIVSMNNGYLGIDYSKLSVIALKAIDILHDKNQELEARLLALEAKLNS